jgi:hypothetical protein
MRSSSPRSSPSPPCTVSGLSPQTARPLEGAGGGRGAAGWRGWFQRLKQCHGDTLRQVRGGVSASPSPSAPPPRGDIPSIQCHGQDEQIRGSMRSSSPRSFPSPPCTVSGLSPDTARPLGRGREEARNAPGGGGVSTSHGKECLVDTLRQVRGEPSPPPPSPSAPPPRGDSPIDTVSRDLAVSSRFHLILLKDPVPVPGTAFHRPNHHALPAPSSGRVVSRRRRFTAPPCDATQINILYHRQRLERYERSF